jgi:hypothetical protein
MEGRGSLLDAGTTVSTGADSGAAGLGQVSEAKSNCPPPSLTEKVTSVQGPECSMPASMFVPCWWNSPTGTGKVVPRDRSCMGSNPIWPSAPKQRTMPRGVPRGTREKSSRTIVSSRRSTGMRESSGMTSEGRWYSTFYKTGLVSILTDSPGIYQSHFQLRFLEYWRLVVSRELNPLASPRLFTHHTGH